MAHPSSSFKSSGAAAAMARLAWWVKLCCAVGGLTTLIAPMVFWSQPDWVEAAFHERWLNTDALLQLDNTSLFLGWLSGWLVGGLRLYALWQVWVLFSCYQRNEVFAPEPVRRLRRFAMALVAHTLASPLGDTLAVLALTLGNPPGKRIFILGLGFEHGFSLFFGLLFWAMARVMFEATRVAQENAEFI